MQKVTWAGPAFRYRWVLGDLTDMSDAQDLEFLRDLMASLNSTLRGNTFATSFPLTLLNSSITAGVMAQRTEAKTGLNTAKWMSVTFIQFVVSFR
jgi:hypothetical protein